MRDPSNGIPASQFAVILPYFQRRADLLPRAIASVRRQLGVKSLIVVVDDGSPVPARTVLPMDDREGVVLIEQANAGPAAARNRGLEALHPAVEFIAFLDTDDEWHSDHLRNAAIAFDHGADFYFCDWRREGDAETRFDTSGVIRPEGTLIPSGEQLYQCTSDLFDAILRRAPVGTSGVVFRRSVAPLLRFRHDLSAGEDNLFWMGLIAASRSIVYSTRCEAFYGKGVNIAAGAVWRDSGTLRHLSHGARMHGLLPSLFPLTASQTAWNRKWRAELRRSFAESFLALLYHRERTDWHSVFRYCLNDSRLMATIIMVALRQVAIRSKTGMIK